MNIAHFVGTLKKDDGVGRVIMEITEHAKKQGYKSMIVTGLPEDPEVFPAEVVKAVSLRPPFRSEYALSLPTLRGIRARLDAFRPDLIHLHSPDPIATAAAKYAREKGIPIIATHHTDFARYLPFYHLGWLEPIVWWMLRRVYRRVDLVTTPSQVMADDLVAHGIKNVQALPWGVNLENFSPRFRSDVWRKNITTGMEKIILFLSRLVWEKDLMTLVKTYELLENNHINAVVVVAGEGPAKAELQKLMPKAKFVGYLKGEALSTAYASADIFLFPSTTETFGNVTIEAMASGIVPVVANAGGSKSIVQDGKNGLLSAPKDAASFYQNVCLLIDDQEKYQRIQAAGLRYVQSFSWERVLDGLFGLYGKLCGKEEIIV